MTATGSYLKTIRLVEVTWKAIKETFRSQFVFCIYVCVSASGVILTLHSRGHDQHQTYKLLYWGKSLFCFINHTVSGFMFGFKIFCRKCGFCFLLQCSSNIQTEPVSVCLVNTSIFRQGQNWNLNFPNNLNQNHKTGDREDSCRTITGVKVKQIEPHPQSLCREDVEAATQIPGDNSGD